MSNSIIHQDGCPLRFGHFPRLTLVGCKPGSPQWLDSNGRPGPNRSIAVSNRAGASRFVKTSSSSFPPPAFRFSGLQGCGVWGCVGFENNSWLTLNNQSCGDFTPKADMGEGFETIIVKTHILKHHIPEHPSFAVSATRAPTHRLKNSAFRFQGRTKVETCCLLVVMYKATRNRKGEKDTYQQRDITHNCQKTVLCFVFVFAPRWGRDCVCSPSYCCIWSPG